MPKAPMDGLQELEDAISRPASYPRNLSSLGVLDYKILSLEDQLNQRQAKLFCQQVGRPSRKSKPAVAILERNHRSEGQSISGEPLPVAESNAML